MGNKLFSVRRSSISAFIQQAIILALLTASISLIWQQTTAVNTAVITVNSAADTTTAGDSACTLREAINNANSDSDTTGGDCAAGAASDEIRFTDALKGQTIALNGNELSPAGIVVFNGPGAQLLTISGNNASRVFNIGSGNTIEITGLTIADGQVADENGGGILNAGTLIVRNSTIVENSITSGGTTNGGGIHNTGAMTITHSAIISNTNLGTTARGGGIASSDGQLTIVNSTISGNSSNTWGGGVHNTGSSVLTVNHSTIANNTAVTFWGGGLIVDNNTTATIKNSILAENEDTTGFRDCYYFGVAPISQGYNLVENRGNCSFSATGDLTGQDVYLGALADNGGPAIDYADNPTAAAGQATWTHALLANSPAIDRIPAGINGCTLGQSTDQRSYYRADACDSGAYEYDGLQITIDATIDDNNPGPGQIVTYTVVVAVTESGPVSADGVIVTDTLPNHINFVGPVTAVNNNGHLTTTNPPTLISGATITEGTAVTLTIPVSVSIGLAGGTIITNTIFADSAETGQPATNWQALTVRNVPPVAVGDTPTVYEDSGTTNFAVQSNDYDLNGDSLSFVTVGTPDNGGTAVSSSDKIAYEPTLNFNGTEVFTYTLSDGSLTHNNSVTVTVIPVNDDPVIGGSETVNVAVNEDEVLSPFNFSAGDVDGDLLTWVVVDGEGTAVISDTTSPGSSSATITYTLASDFVGLDSFQVRAGDGELTDTVTVNVTVSPLNDAPRAGDDYLFLVPSDDGTAITLNPLTNDIEIDGQTMTLASVGQPSVSGTAQISGTMLVYTPTLTLGQTETFTYTVSDGSLTDTAVIQATVVEGLGSGRPDETITVGGIDPSASMTMSLVLPANIAANENFGLVIRETAGSPPPLTDYHPAGLAVTLDAYIDGALTTPYTLTTPITLTLTYTETAFEHLIRGEMDLALYYRGDSQWLTDGITLIERDMENNRLVFTINRLTDFALFGWDGFPVYLPLIVRGP